MDVKARKYAKVDVDSDTYWQVIILILQFLAEENCEESLHLLEQESNVYFNLKYFGDRIINGEWEKAENYLSAFTRLGDSLLSRKVFFEMRKQKYYEAMLRNDLAEAATILQKDLSVFSASSVDNYEEFTLVHSSESIREDEKLSWYVNTAHARANLQSDLKKLIEGNPTFQDKLVFPKLNNSGLMSIMYLIYPSPEKKTSIKEELIYLILQFLDEEKFMVTLHKLEQETKIFFNLNYFGKLLIHGEWDEAEKYLSAFIKLDNQYPLLGIFEMQAGRHLEGFDGKNDILSNYMDASSVGADLFDGLNQFISKYPLLLDKLKFPCMDKSRLLTIIKQTMDWWVPHCSKARANPDNRAFSLDNIPRVPYLCYDPSVLISSSETGQSSIPWICGSNDTSCMTAVNSGVSLRITEKSKLQVTENCTSQKEMKIGSNCLIDLNLGVGIKSSTEITEINEPSQCCLLVLPDDSLMERVARLNYSCSGDFILALAQNAMHKVWMLYDDKCLSGKAITDIQPFLHQPSNGQVMTNDVGVNPEHNVHCFALKDHRLLSASGGRISIYNLKTFETVETIAVPPPVATYFIFLPQDILAIGLDDSTIIIYCTCTKKQVKAKLHGHQKTTCLAFSHNLNVLVSSGADAQLCVWDAAGWKKLANKTLHSFHTGQVPDPPVVNYMEFHKNQFHLLSVHERQIDIYEAPWLNHYMQSVPPESDLPITYATYSCDGQSIFVSFKNGCIKVISSETLDVRCRINLTAYAQPNPSLEVYPTVMAANPYKPNQIAVGLTNGRVIVLEPLASEGLEKEWALVYILPTACWSHSAESDFAPL